MKNHGIPASYEEAVAYLQGRPFFGKRPDPDNTFRLLSLLGHPEKDFCVIHVAGTNGKGSCCAFLESIFRQMGRKTGLFTSPHLVRINERIRVCGQEIPDEEFLEAFLKVREAAGKLVSGGGQEPTYFETLLAAGLCWFRKAGIDLLVMETGLGGRLDATNAVRKAAAVVITSISLDHTKYLGDTVEKIAAEKAGIIREGVPVVYCAKDPAGAAVIARKAREMNAPQIPLREDAFRVTGQDLRSLNVDLMLPQGGRCALHIPFGALYQAENACLAALCALSLGADEAAVRDGIGKTRWEGRMQEIEKDVFLDGAHNPDGIRKIAAEIRRRAKTRGVWLLCGISRDKDHRAMVRELCQGVKYEGVTVTQVPGERAMDAEALAGAFRLAGQEPVFVQADVKTAFDEAKRARGEDVLFCVGSLYLIGEILSGTGEGEQGC